MVYLFYFVVKNYFFLDGNKCSGVFLFVDFLYRNGCLFDYNGYLVINDIGFVVFILLVVEFDLK